MEKPNLGEPAGSFPFWMQGKDFLANKWRALYRNILTTNLETDVRSKQKIYLINN